jgi:hypothetical protein
MNGYGNPGNRGREIEAFLNSVSEKVTSFAIVDDNPWMMPTQDNQFVRTDCAIGLTVSDADRLIRILGEIGPGIEN